MKELTVNEPVLDDDGYSVTKFIQAQERLYDAVRFTFRPLTPIELAKVRDGIEGLKEVPTTLALAGLLSKRMTQWDAKDRKGNVLPLTVDSLTRKIHPSQLARLFRIVVWSSDGGDVDPLESLSEDDVKSIPDLLADDGGTGLIESELKN